MHKKKIVVLGILILLIFMGYAYSDKLVVFTDQEYIREVVEAYGVFGPIVFILIYAAGLLIGLPAIPLTLAAGYIFGFLMGTVYVLFIATLMAAIGFYIPRLSHVTYQTKKSGKKTVTKKVIKYIEKEVDENGFLTLLLVRPLFNYMLLSYAAGFIKKIRFRDFFLATIATNIIFTPVYVLVGDRITSGLQGLLFPLSLVIVVLCINLLIKKIKKKKKHRR